jgi:hypothetical protein
MITPAPLSADALAYRVQMLERIRTDLAALHADAETHRLPQSVTLGLHWLCEDAASTLADLHNLAAPQAAP